jgi:hypothetical protein
MNIAIAPGLGYPGSILSQEESAVYLAAFRALLRTPLPNLETVQVLAGPAASASGSYFRELAAVCAAEAEADSSESWSWSRSVRNLVVPIDAYCVCPAFTEVRHITVVPNLFSDMSKVACEEDSGERKRELLLTAFCGDIHGLRNCAEVEEVRFMPLQGWETECVVPCKSLFIIMFIMYRCLC